MHVVHTDENTVQFLDEAGMTFMALVIDRLNDRLKADGIDDSARRQEICAGFLFDFAYYLDAGWLIHGEQKLFPKLCFAEREPALEGENLGALKTLLVPTEAVSLHESAHGVVSQYFDIDGESVADIRSGSYDLES